MVARPTCVAKKGNINYAKLNQAGREAAMSEAEGLEEGQLMDSPFRVEVEEDEFNTESISQPSRPAQSFSDVQSVDLHGKQFVPDYLDDISDQATNVNSEEAENDLGLDEVWRQKSRAMQENREWREWLRKRLVHQKMVVEEKLMEEKEKAELARMEQEIV